MIASKTHFLNASDDWRNAAPASSDQARAKAASALTTKQRAELQAAEDGIAEAQAELAKHCNTAALDAEGLAIMDDDDLNPDEVVAKLQAIETKRAAIPAITEKLNRRIDELIESMRPAAVVVVQRTLEIIEEELDTIQGTPLERHAFWGLSNKPDFQDWKRLPLLRLQSILQAKLRWLDKAKGSLASKQNAWVIRQMLETAAIKAKGPVPCLGQF